MSSAGSERRRGDVRLASATSVKHAIARCMLGESSGPASVGSINLYQHQTSAVVRIRHALREFGGALLCDAVGLGKTYAALAVAASYQDLLIVAPAVLRTMWQQALDHTRISADFVSFEALSRGNTVDRAYALIIADEAHHFRNPATKRYAELARLCIRAKILLLSATPVHNSRLDLASLAALFMGHRAYALDVAALSRIIVRRATAPRQTGAAIPLVEHATWHVVPSDDSVLERIAALPPPVPPSDGGNAAALVTQGLVRQWVSSSAALAGALKRRMARSHALIAALDAGSYPTRAELSSWVFADDALQLAFPELLPTSDFIAPELRGAVAAHLEGLRLLALYASTSRGDDELRAAFVRQILHSHTQEKVVAFTSYRETAAALYRSLAPMGGVALMTASGGTVAGGALTRREALERFAPLACGTARPPRCDEIRMLIATDLLSEGVNLQDASVVIHLDIPWTAARMEQRVGRVARLGSRHSAVTSYTLRPSERAEALLHVVRTVEHKSHIAITVLGPATGPPNLTLPPGDNCIELAESIRVTLEQWRCLNDESGDADVTTNCVADVPLVAALSCGRSMAIVACLVDGRPELLVLDEALRVSTRAASVSAAITLATGNNRDVPLADVGHVQDALVTWYQHQRAATDVGIDYNSTGTGSHRGRRAAIRSADATIADRSFAARGESAKWASLLRAAATAPMPIALERMMDADSSCQFCSRDEAGLPAIRVNHATSDGGLTVVAILLLGRTT